MKVTSEDCQNLSDNELVALSLQDKENFLCLMRRYEGKLLAYIKRLTKANKEDAEDILQEVFIKVFRNINDFDQSLKFSSWIYRITHNHVISRHRKLKARPEGYQDVIEDSAFQNIASDFSLDKEIDNILDKQKLMSVIETLDEKYRDVIILRYWEEKEYEEISDILKIPMGTVATFLSRAKKKLLDEIQKRKIEFDIKI